MVSTSLLVVTTPIYLPFPRQILLIIPFLWLSLLIPEFASEAEQDKRKLLAMFVDIKHKMEQKCDNFRKLSDAVSP